MIGKEVTVDSLTVPSRSHSHPTYGSLRQSRTLSRGFICCPRGRYVYVNTGYGYVETTLVWYTSVYIYVLGYISVVPHTTTTPSAVVTYGLKCHICRICGDGPWCSHIRRKKGKLCFHYCTVHGNFRQLTLTFAGNNANGSVRRRTQSHSHCHTVTVTSR